MTYTSLTVKLLAASALGVSLLLFPQQASSNDVIVNKPVEAVVATQSPAPVKKPVVQKVIQGDCTKYADLIEKYDWPVTIAMTICKKESSGNPKNINWTDAHYDSKGNLICMTSRGLMQVACFWPADLGYKFEDLLDPVKNIEMAYQIYLLHGFNPWTTYTPIKINLGIVK